MAMNLARFNLRRNRSVGRKTCGHRAEYLQRQGNDFVARHVDVLRETARQVRGRYPFTIHDWVVLPNTHKE